MGKKTNAPNWEKIKAEYIKGGISQQKLADKYGINRSTLQGRMYREGWNELRTCATTKASQKLVEKTADIKADTAARILQMQSDAVLSVYAKLLDTLKNFPSGVGTKNVREMVEVKTLEVNGEKRDFPLRKTFTSDLEAVVRSMTALARLYGIDAASTLAIQKAQLESSLDANLGETTDSANEQMLSLANLINNPIENVTIEEAIAQTEEGDEND